MVEPSPSASPAVAESPSPSPIPETLDGTWKGETSKGRAFAFTVVGDEITKLALPASPCGAGMPSSIRTRAGFKGMEFEVSAPGFPYTLYTGGASTTMQDMTIVSGIFDSMTDASGTIVTQVLSDAGVLDECSLRWQASHA